MTRTKKFNRTRFKAETLRAARGSLEKIAKVSKKTYRFEWFAVTKLNGEHWRYDSLEEFLAAYSEEVEWASWTLRLDENKFELEVEVRDADTNISVSAESNCQINAIINLFIEAQPSATLEAPASVGDSLLTNEEPPTFKCSKQLPSCHVDRRLVEELETYVLSEASRITCNPIADVKSDYALSIVDQTGNEVVTSAAQLEGQQFHNSTSQIAQELRRFRLRFASTRQGTRRWTAQRAVPTNIRPALRNSASGATSLKSRNLNYFPSSVRSGIGLDLSRCRPAGAWSLLVV